jgi:hypothetical protein
MLRFDKSRPIYGSLLILAASTVTFFWNGTEVTAVIFLLGEEFVCQR